MNMKFFLLSVALVLVGCGGGSSQKSKTSSKNSSKANTVETGELNSESVADGKEGSEALEGEVQGDKSLEKIDNPLDEDLDNEVDNSDDAGDGSYNSKLDAIDQDDIDFEDDGTPVAGSTDLDLDSEADQLSEKNKMSASRISSLVSSTASFVLLAVMFWKRTQIDTKLTKWDEDSVDGWRGSLGKGYLYLKDDHGCNLGNKKLFSWLKKPEGITETTDDEAAGDDEE